MATPSMAGKQNDRRRRFLQVIVEMPDHVSIREARAYIRGELKAAGGQFRPDDPLFRGVKVLSICSTSWTARGRP
jgi:hypothetical protein